MACIAVAHMHDLATLNNICQSFDHAVRLAKSSCSQATSWGDLISW